MATQIAMSTVSELQFLFQICFSCSSVTFDTSSLAYFEERRYLELELQRNTDVETGNLQLVQQKRQR